LINHYVLTHNIEYNLKLCLDSISQSTQVEQRIIVVYNGKCDCQTKSFFKEFPSIDVYYVGFNAFTFGVYLAMNKYQNIDDEYFALSDGDFIFPDEPNGDWLEDFIAFMDENPFVGRTGLGIDLKNIENNYDFREIFSHEISYKTGFVISKYYNAPIDTTPALYRRNIFYWGNKILPGHMTGMKPHLYSMRSRDHEGYHLGWDTNKYQVSNFQIPLSNLISFALFNGSLPKSSLSRQPIISRILFLFLRFFFRLFWRSFKLSALVLYMLRRKLFLLNEIENRFDRF
jgi:hypothetical protein